MGRFSRRSFLRAAVLGSTAVAFGFRPSSKAARRTTKPNLLVFLPDELRTDTIIGGTASQVHAPNLHQLASESFVFERTYVTHPICSPSRSSLLTGMWPHQTGCTNNKGVLPQNSLCLPQMLADNYRTGYFGKWHLGDEFSPQHGFQEWISIEDSFKAVEHGHKTAGASDYTKFLLAKGYKPDRSGGKCFSLEFPTRLPFELSKAKFLETKACDFLERHRHEHFILFVAFLEPHPPYNGPFNTEHPLEDVVLDPTIDNVLREDLPLRSRLLQEYYRKQVGTIEGYREIKQRYFGLISEIDRSIGAILTKLENLGLMNRTITVLTSDHGDMMGANGILGKQLMYDASASVPFVVRVPWLKPGRFSDPVSHIDFVPTMLDLCGKPPHGQCAGQSSAALIRGKPASAEFAFLQWSPGKDEIEIKNSALAGKREIQNCLSESTRAVVSPDGWKLCLRDRDKNELYNINEDPNELQNLYYGGNHRDTIAALTRRIHQWQRLVRDRIRV